MNRRVAYSVPGRIVGVFVALASLAGAGCQGPVLAPTPNLYWATDERPFDDVPEALQSNVVEIVYATDRKPIVGDDGKLRYGWGRSHSLAAGMCKVEIGKDISWDELVEASTTRHRKKELPLRLIEIDETVRLPPSNTPRVLLDDGGWAHSPEYVAELAAAGEAIRDLVRERLALTPHKDVFLFVHGYNNTFEDAAFRMAQLWHFLGRRGVPVLYSWPAGRTGMLRGYTHDRESSEFTVFHLKQLSRALTTCDEIKETHVIGHSRGTQVVLDTLRELWIEMRGAEAATTGGDPATMTWSDRMVGKRKMKLRNIIIAAGDLDWEVFQQRISAESLPVFSESFVFYLCQEDKALGISAWLYDSISRLGRLQMKDLTPEQQENLAAQDAIQVIDVNVRTDYFAHAYFITNPAVLSDLILTLRDGRRAGAENGRPLKRKDGVFWTLTDDYLVK